MKPKPIKWIHRAKRAALALFFVLFIIQLLFFILVLSNNIPIAFILLLFFFIFDAIIILTFSKKNIVSEILMLSFLVLIISGPFVYSMVYYIKFYLLPSQPNLTKLGEIDTWIVFAGSIISGVLVMLALAYTIQYESKTRLEEKEDQINKLKNELMPIIEIEFIEENKILKILDYCIATKLINSSDSHAFIYSIFPFKVDIIFYETESYIPVPNGDFKDFDNNFLLINYPDEQIIAKNKDQDFSFEVVIPDDIIKTFDNHPYCIKIQHNLVFEIFFSDVLDMQKYKCLYEVSYYLDLDKSRKLRKLICKKIKTNIVGKLVKISEFPSKTHQQIRQNT